MPSPQVPQSAALASCSATAFAYGLTLSMSLSSVKVCGVVSPTDAHMIVRAAREELPEHVRLYLGMIVWPGSRRSVSQAVAKEIAAAAFDGGATPVGVFVDETSSAIADACSSIGISIAQLHGPKCRRFVMEDGLPSSVSAVEVVDVASDGSFMLLDQNMDASSSSRLNPLWRLFDSKGGGTGRSFDWTRFRAPTENWFLAGGLDPENVSEAVRFLQPSGLDVASGVAKDDGCAKDERRLRDFFRNAWVASEEAGSVRDK